MTDSLHAVVVQRDWPEDVPSDGEIFITRCPRCREEFTGHKHRIFCRDCVATEAPHHLPNAK